jgi:hypothetical protein
MGLYQDAEDLIRANLELAATWFALERTARPRQPIVRIGALSEAQLTTINRQRQEEELPPVVAAVLFDGRHMYQSRCIEDGYTIDEVIEMVFATFNDEAHVAPGWSTVLISPTTRVNNAGKTVRHEAVLDVAESCRTRNFSQSFQGPTAKIAPKRRRPPARVAFSEQS